MLMTTFQKISFHIEEMCFIILLRSIHFTWNIIHSVSNELKMILLFKLSGNSD
jgi:hypothetical protein